MTKIRKYQVMTFLELFEIKGCKTIEDIKNLLNKELKNDTDVVFQWRIGVSQKDFEIPEELKEDIEII